MPSLAQNRYMHRENALKFDFKLIVFKPESVLKFICHIISYCESSATLMNDTALLHRDFDALFKTVRHLTLQFLKEILPLFLKWFEFRGRTR